MNGLYLGIDTSCYTTSVACIQGESIVFDERTVLSVPLGGRGLRQSDALFQHNRNLPPLVERLFAAIDHTRIQAVGVSVAPTAQPDSYMPVFLAGRLAAKSIAAARGVPCVETTHQLGHVHAALHGGNEALLAQPDALALHLSGGTTDVLELHMEAGRIAEILPLGCSADLHAGQMVDRVGVALGLPFPSGPALEALAREATARSCKLPSSVCGVQCSFSGAESQAQRLIEAGEPQAEIAYGVYDCLGRTVAKLIAHAAEATGCRTALLSGGVASSLLLRELVEKRMQPGLSIHWGQPALSSDNAVGVALAARDTVCRTRD